MTTTPFKSPLLASLRKKTLGTTTDDSLASTLSSPSPSSHQTPTVHIADDITPHSKTTRPATHVYQTPEFKQPHSKIPPNFLPHTATRTSTASTGTNFSHRLASLRNRSLGHGTPPATIRGPLSSTQLHSSTISSHPHHTHGSSVVVTASESLPPPPQASLEDCFQGTMLSPSHELLHVHQHYRQAHTTNSTSQVNTSFDMTTIHDSMAMNHNEQSIERGHFITMTSKPEESDFSANIHLPWNSSSSHNSSSKSMTWRPMRASHNSNTTVESTQQTTVHLSRDEKGTNALPLSGRAVGPIGFKTATKPSSLHVAMAPSAAAEDLDAALAAIQHQRQWPYVKDDGRSDFDHDAYSIIKRLRISVPEFGIAPQLHLIHGGNGKVERRKMKEHHPVVHDEDHVLHELRDLRSKAQEKLTEQHDSGTVQLQSGGGGGGGKKKERKKKATPLPSQIEERLARLQLLKDKASEALFMP